MEENKVQTVRRHHSKIISNMYKNAENNLTDYILSANSETTSCLSNWKIKNLAKERDKDPVRMQIDGFAFGDEKIQVSKSSGSYRATLPIKCMERISLTEGYAFECTVSSLIDIKTMTWYILIKVPQRLTTPPKEAGGQ